MALGYLISSTFFQLLCCFIIFSRSRLPLDNIIDPGVLFVAGKQRTKLKNSWKCVSDSRQRPQTPHRLFSLIPRTISDFNETFCYFESEIFRLRGSSASTLKMENMSSSGEINLKLDEIFTKKMTTWRNPHWNLLSKSFNLSLMESHKVAASHSHILKKPSDSKDIKNPFP